MFTGLVQVVGRIANLDQVAGKLGVEVPVGTTGVLAGAKVGDSISVNGVCLTVTSICHPGQARGAGADPGSSSPLTFTTDLGQETINCTTFATLEAGAPVNLEPCLTLETPLGGHLVSGHVNGVVEILGITDSPSGNGDKIYRFAMPKQHAQYVVEKGSACINGVSLTVVSVSEDEFSIMLIPYTLQNTNLGTMQLGSLVNFELDLIARYACAGKSVTKQSLIHQNLVQQNLHQPNFVGSTVSQNHFSAPEELIAEIKQGRMVIILDDENRENEGDLIMAADLVTAEHINFMTRYGRGLVCMPMPQAHGERLQLPLMASANTGTKTTYFTVSIEAATGVTTGISTADRARTIQAAASADATAKDLVTPGHIFPLLARPGGVLEREGHTEAAVDLVTMAGVGNCGVIVEILNEDGTMARRDECVEFAKTHGLKVGTIADLIAYRLGQEEVRRTDLTMR